MYQVKQNRKEAKSGEEGESSRDCQGVSRAKVQACQAGRWFYRAERFDAGHEGLESLDRLESARDPPPQAMH